MISSLELKLRPVLIFLTALMVFIQILFLSPSKLEDATSQLPILRETLLIKEPATLATGIPLDRVPNYSVQGFNYTSSVGLKRDWKIYAKRANTYLIEGTKIVHAREVTANLYDPDGQTTVVTSKEAKYILRKKDQYYEKLKDLEMFGDVTTTFPDGFTTSSPYMIYKPDMRSVNVPVLHPVHGVGHDQNGQDTEFFSNGMEFKMGDSLIILPENVKFIMTKRDPKKDGSIPEKTEIISDKCSIDRNQQKAFFTMNENRPLKERFVKTTQPSLFVRSRTSELNYGDFAKMVNYMVALKDVYIQELDEKSEERRYATSGRADFDTKKSIITLTQYPQVYQNDDTVTGDIIILHRDSDIVEIENSNAFSEGQSSDDSK